MKRSSAQETAMTLLEILVVIAVVTVMIAFMFPSRPHGGKGVSVVCMSHLRQIDIGFIIYTGDNGGKFPMQYSITNGGTAEFLQSNQTFPHYQKLSQYISPVEVLICPADKNRHTATNYNNMGDTNLSYFLNVDVSTNSPASSILAGDRNLEANGKPVPSGMFSASTNLNMSFTSELHPIVDMLAFADGHVEACRKTNLNWFIKHQNLVTARFSVP